KVKKLPNWVPAPKVVIIPKGFRFKQGDNWYQYFEVKIIFLILSKNMKRLEKIVDPSMVKDTSISGLVVYILEVLFKWGEEVFDQSQNISVGITPIDGHGIKDYTMPVTPFSTDDTKDAA
ncbi:MAG: hypothetical protein GY940_00335, partial [bacterium]|nr:hypothetical protein [bacterium]